MAGTSASWETNSLNSFAIFFRKGCFTKNEKACGLQDTNSCKFSLHSEHIFNYFCTIMYPNSVTFCNSSLILSNYFCTFPVALHLQCLQFPFACTYISIALLFRIQTNVARPPLSTPCIHVLTYFTLHPIRKLVTYKDSDINK